MKRTPWNWFFRLTGPPEPEGSLATELFAILMLPDLSERPRTMPENHEVVEEDDEEGDDDSREEDDDAERFISDAMIGSHYP